MQVEVTLSFKVNLGTDPAEVPLAMAQLMAFVGGARAMWHAVQQDPQPPSPAAPAQPDPPQAQAPAPTDDSNERRRSRRLSFEAFDAKVRSEMQRLAVGGVLPSTGKWDTERDPSLPTLLAVMRRYGVQTSNELATLLGLNPPAYQRKPKETNGHQAGNFL